MLVRPTVELLNIQEADVIITYLGTFNSDCNAKQLYRYTNQNIKTHIYFV